MYKYNLFEKMLFPHTYLNENNLRAEIEGKTILITGASSGIGEQVAYQLANKHVRLLLVARREEKLLMIKNEIEQEQARVSVFCADLRKKEEMDKLLAFIHQLPYGLDIVVSNAGHSIHRSIFHSLDRYHDFTRTMAINYFAPVQLLLAVIPLLIKNKGQIINISTINTMLLPIPDWASYQASKSAFDVWLRSVTPELQAKGISLTSIYLPLVKTPMITPTTAYKKMPAMNPVQVAKIICKSMYTKRKRYKPWWVLFGALASVLFRGTLERVTARLYKRREER